MRRTAMMVLLLIGVLAACGNDSPAGKDTGQAVDNAEAHLTTFENHEDFNNVVAFCDGTTRVYTTTEWAPVYVTDAVQCGGTGELTHISNVGGR